MPRLSLYNPNKGHDYKFIDKTIYEMFQVGGTDVLIHKYLGVKSEDGPDPTGTTDDLFKIQDIVLLENRDRKYDEDVFVLRGVYNVQDIDFNLSQFGLFLQNDTVFITFHINDTVQKIGRKLISGDVIELPHLKDEYALNDLSYALKRFYVIEDVNRAAEGFSQTWYPHLYRAKCMPLVDSQEFKDILDKVGDSENVVGNWNPDVTYHPGEIVTGPDGRHYTVTEEVTGIAPPDLDHYELSESLHDILSTYNKEMQITKGVMDAADADTPLSGFDTASFFTLQQNDDGKAELVTVDSTDIDASISTPATDINGDPLFDENGEPVYVGPTASTMLQTAEHNGYNGYITEDGKPPNGAPFTSGIAFPYNPVEGQYHLRTDFMPTRLFRYTKNRWSKVEDSLRMTMNNLGESDVGEGSIFDGMDVRQTQKTSFINNTNVDIIDGHETVEKQSLSKALRPKADE